MKKLAFVLLSLLLALSLFACDSGDGGKDSLDDYVAPDYTYTMRDDKNNILGTLTFEDGLAETAVITAYAGKSTVHDVTIPDMINEREVSGIGANAFYQLSTVRTVVMPDTVTYIGEFAFAGCTALETIVIPASVTHIDDFAFYGCTSLKKVIFDGNALTSIGDFAFLDCTALSDISLPAGLESIGNQAFGRCESITSIKLPASVNSIGSLAFSDCKGLNSDGALDLSALTAPKSDNEWIKDFAFKGINKIYIKTALGSYAAEYVNSMADITEE